MQLVYSNTVKLVAMMAMLCMLVLPYLVVPSSVNAATVNGSPTDYGLTIYKYKQDPINENNPAGSGIDGQTPTGTPIADVTFEITQTHTFNPATNAWTAVTGATPITGVTDASGKIVFNQDTVGFELGRYTVKETAGPNDIVLNTTEYSVDVPMTNADGNNLNYKVAIYPKNEMLRGAVELTKTGEANEALAGAVFELYKVGTPNEKIGTTYTTNVDGKVYVDGLVYGDYYFVETKAPAGYLIDLNELKFSISKVGAISIENGNTTLVGQVEKAALKNYEVPTIKKDVEGTTHYNVNRDTEYTYNLTLDLPANIHEYKEYKVTDILDPRLTYANSWTVTGTASSNITFNESTTIDGKKEILTWTVNDLKALENVQKLVISFKSKIKPDASLQPTGTGIPNYAILEFENNHGIKTKPMDPNTPPNPDNPKPEDPTDPPTTPPVTVTPTDGGLKVIKVDASDNNIKLQGAEFKITTDKDGQNVIDATGTIIKVNGQAAGKLENLVTDTNGEIYIEGLSAGTYYLHETKAPTYVDADGKTQSYRILTAPKEVIIPNPDQLIDVVVENSKSGWFLPQTGGLGTVLFTAIGLGLMLLALIILKRRKNEPSNA